jgi:hypothetical protein
MVVTIKATGKIFLSVIPGSIMAIFASKLSVYLRKREDVLTFILEAILNTIIATTVVY